MKRATASPRGERQRLRSLASRSAVALLLGALAGCQFLSVEGETPQRDWNLASICHCASHVAVDTDPLARVHYLAKQLEAREAWRRAFPPETTWECEIRAPWCVCCGTHREAQERLASAWQAELERLSSDLEWHTAIEKVLLRSSAWSRSAWPFVRALGDPCLGRLSNEALLLTLAFVEPLGVRPSSLDGPYPWKRVAWRLLGCAALDRLSPPGPRSKAWIQGHPLQRLYDELVRLSPRLPPRSTPPERLQRSSVLIRLARARIR